ncbi:FecCD family ABC transporter permease [Desulfotalea psychrophila]|uniref:Probable iron (III) ABC transporter, permease protein n=1 Tax=Desulfotalea psychrophila (strain LSv54 / DSM 12343) TaxID=177439 RepID=Q6AIX2_DESPS|nr:iron ABC transporter permease [Desulfotalea psychrophila]CAG37708.1 probable iron (III) ABC transporter, permease protein [Desulfotalea psychrophila LSv54]
MSNKIDEKRVYLILFSLLALLILLSACIGRMPLAVSEVFWAVAKFPSLLWTVLQGDYGSLTESERVLFLIRFPRMVLALAVGCGLSVSGAVYQGLFRNPLVSPDILGVAAGCTLGAAIGLLLPGSSFAVVRLLSFIMGLLAVSLALGLARAVPTSKILVLVLSGIIIGSLFHACLMIVKIVADPYGELPAIVFWTMGSLSGASWQDTLQIVPIIACGYLIFHIFRYRLNVLSLGDGQAKALGVNPRGLRLFLIAVSSLMIAVCVSSCGQIAWVGLVVPHIVRTCLGPNHRLVVPCSALLGAIFLLGADDIARSAMSCELPLGVITSLIGGPIFAWLLYKNQNRGWV